MLGLSFSLLRCKGSENQASTDRTPSKMKILQRTVSHACPACPFAQRLDTHRLRSLWHQFFGTIALMEFVLKNPCQQLCSFSLAPCQRSNACPMAQGLQTLAALGCTVFRNNRIDEICPEKPVPTAVHFECCPLPTKLCMSHRPTFANHLESLGRTVFRDNRIDGICPENPCQQLCFSVRRFLPTELPPSYFPRFPFRPTSRHSRIAPSHRSSPQAISHGFPSVHPVVTPVSLLPTGALPKLFPTVYPPSTLSSLPYRSFPPGLSPSYFPRLPFRPPCRTGALPKLFHTVSLPSTLYTLSSFPYRSFPPGSPQAISHGFPSVHPLVASVSLLPTRLSPSYFTWFPFRPPSCRFRIAPSHPALPKLFHMVSLPSTLLSLPLYRSFPPELSTSYHTVSLPSTLSSLPYRSFPPELSPSYFPRFPFRPPCRHSRIAPSHRALPKLFHMVSLPSTLSSLPYRSFPPELSPPELSPSYFTRFPFRPPSCRFRIAPSHRNSPQAISHGFPSVHPVVIPVSLLPTGALPKLFHTVSLPSTLSSLPYRSFPPELSPSYFTRFPFRPPCRHSRIAPSHRSSPQAISHGFPSVHPVVTPVSLLPTGALPKLFPTVSLPSTLSSLPYRSFPPELSPSYFTRFPFRPPCRHSSIAPSHRSSPQAISHGFPSVHPVVIPVSLLPTGALPKLFHTVSLPSTLSSSSIAPSTGLSPSYFTRFPFRPPCRHSRIAPSHRSSPQAISHGFPSVYPVVTPVSLLSHRSSPQAISHGFPSVHLVVTPVSLLPTGALPKLFPTVSLPSTLSSLPYRSFPPELSPSYFPRFPFRPPCRHSSIAPSHRSSPQAISHGFPSVHPVVIPVSLLPTGALPKLFHTVSLPSTLSSFQYRSFPPELSPSYFTRFPFRPPCRHSSIAPSHRSSPQAISHGFPSVHLVVTPVSLLPTGALPTGAISHGFPSVHPVVIPVSLLPTGALPKLFHTVSLPSTLSSFSHRSSPQAISHGFPSVHPVVTPVSLLPTGALPMLFPTVSSPSTQSLLPSVPSQRSSPHAISHGFLSLHPIVASIRSLPA